MCMSHGTLIGIFLLVHVYFRMVTEEVLMVDNPSSGVVYSYGYEVDHLIS